MKRQNTDESLDGIIWNRIPELQYTGLQKLELGVYNSIAIFNYNCHF